MTSSRSQSPPSSPPAGVGPATPTAVTPAMEERLVRRIHKRMGGQGRLKGISDPAVVRHIVLSALAEDQTTRGDADRVMRNALSVLERRAVRTVTNRGAAVRSRQRQRVHLSELRAALALKDHQLSALRKAFGAVQNVLADLDVVDMDAPLDAACTPVKSTNESAQTAFPMLELSGIASLDSASSPVTPSHSSSLTHQLEVELSMAGHQTPLVSHAPKICPPSPPALQLAAPVEMPQMPMSAPAASASGLPISGSTTPGLPASVCTTPAALSMDDPVADILNAFNNDSYWEC